MKKTDSVCGFKWFGKDLRQCFVKKRNKMKMIQRDKNNMIKMLKMQDENDVKASTGLLFTANLVLIQLKLILDQLRAIK